MSADTIRLPGGKTITLGRAVALGLANRDGTLTAKGQSQDSQGAKAERDAARAEEWQESQGLKKGKKQPVILVPRNVKDGEPIEDEETLAAIAERTAAIEAAKGDASGDATPEEGADTPSKGAADAAD